MRRQETKITTGGTQATSNRLAGIISILLGLAMPFVAPKPDNESRDSYTIRVAATAEECSRLSLELDTLKDDLSQLERAVNRPVYAELSEASDGLYR